ncbi:MAG TPA: hypothetical protein VMF55_08295 [Solirubrobacterales bacterium]|nr:hypothetical protein [Solirubrobacterales bacterium]
MSVVKKVVGAREETVEGKGVCGMKGTSVWRRALGMVAACVIVAAVAAPTASANFEFKEVGVSVHQPTGEFTRQAGAHPDFTFTYNAPTEPGNDNIPLESPRDIDLDLPPGLVGNPVPFPACSLSEFNSVKTGGWTECERNTQVGTVRFNNGNGVVYVGLYNLEHGSEVPARFGFSWQVYHATITPRVRPGDYGISAGSFEIGQALPAASEAEVTFWGIPASHEHDFERVAAGAPFFNPSGEVWNFLPLETTAPDVPFFYSPTYCPDTASTFTARGDSWEHPGIFDTRTFSTDAQGTPFAWEGCEVLPFKPTLIPVPGTHRAHSPTGLDVAIEVPSNEGPEGFMSSAIKKTVIVFPEGVTVSPSAVGGLEACSEAQAGLGNNEPPTCPDGSKIGNVQIKTQLQKNPLEGEVVLARQKENPFGSTYAAYLLAKGPGFYVKLASELNVDQKTGQLTVVFDNLPQLPFETAHFDFRGGPTSPLVTPDTCGNYSIRTEMYPWARPAEPVVANVPMVINENCAGGGTFNPSLQAGVANPVAGAQSPLTIRVRRQDGEQNLSRLEFTLPEGELASLKGVALCPDALAPSGNCPVASQVGIATTALGTGAFPLFVPQPGKAPTALYLAGPYEGAPYSLITTVPAQAGPFDFGNIVVRTAINLNPNTTQVIARSDPLPQILEGVPIAYRDVRIEVQKPDFTVNPTSCEQRYVTSTISSIEGAQAHPSVPFKVGDCASLNFKPKLALKLKGGTHRGDFPQLTATLTTGKKESNISWVSTTLPHSEFLEQGHIGTVCTRVQFAAKACPAASVYGYATAYTPLLERPLEGPVYLRSSNHTLPDLVAELNGQFDVELAGRIDSHNQGIRTTFETVPDAPVTKFVLRFKAGKKSLLVNSRNLCKAPAKATIRMIGQNGMRHDEQPPLETPCGKGKKKKPAKKKAK